MPHNHPPRCCCEPTKNLQLTNGTFTGVCPSCPQHGELAQLADNECPSCHQLPGRPPTDYCRDQGWHTMTRDEHCTCLGGPDRLGHMPDCPLYAATQLDGPKTLTTEPATRTTTPPTQHRDEQPRGHFPTQRCDRPDAHPTHTWWMRNDAYQCPGAGVEPTPLATPTPGQCPSCHLDVDYDPAPSCTTPKCHDHPHR